MKLTLEIDFHKLDPEPTATGLVDALNNVFWDWNDGRKRFSVELIERGLTEVMKLAVFDAVLAEEDKIWKDQMVESTGTYGKYQTSKALLEAERKTKDLMVYIMGNVVAVSIQKEESNADD